MSERDDWRIDPVTRFTDRRENDRFVSDRDIPFLRPEDREDHRRQIEESTGNFHIGGVAMAALIAAGAYAGLRHFPSSTLQKATRNIRDSIASQAKRTKGASWYEKIRKAFSRSGAAQKSGRARGILDSDLQHDVEIAHKLFSARSGYIGNRESALSAMMERYGSKHPQALPMPSAWPQEIRDLARLPQFQLTAGRMGLSARESAAQLAGAAMKRPAPTIGGMLETIASARIPFTPWRPLQLLLPTELLKRGPTLGHVPAQNLPSYRQGMQDTHGFFAGGSLYRVEKFKAAGRTYRAISQEAEAEGMRLGLLGSGMGRAAAERMGGTVARPLSEIFAERPDLAKPKTWWDKIQRFALKVGERFGVGPQYSTRIGFGGRARQAVDVVRSAAAQKDYRFIDPTRPAYGATPEGAFFRRILSAVGLAKTGKVKSAKDLTWIERMKLSAGIEPRRPVEVIRGGKSFIESQPVAEILDRSGSRIRDAYSFAKEVPLRGRHYAFKGVKQGLGDWLNYQINRPLWLLQEATGIGLKMGKGPLESMWNIGTKVVLPGYMGYQALKYADYKSRQYFGYGPISGPAAVYTKARLEAQKILDATGVTDTAQELEERFPGLIESPFSKGTAVVGGTLGGAAIGRQFGAKGGAIGAAAGLVAGLTFASGVRTNAEDLKAIYEGEAEVPVRADRWWVLGRHPFGGSRIKYWKKHWLAEMMSGYKEKALYGSEKESWRGSWLPTPENMFLLKNFYDPYYVENLNYHERPYPSTSPMFEETPLVGPLLGATIGRLIKPTRYRNYEAPYPHGLPRDTFQGQANAELMGLPKANIQAPVPITKWRMSQLTGETIHRLFDWTGLPGFMLGAIKENVTGSRGWMADETVMAASGMMTSPERDFYDRNAGGMLGGTEFLRRFMPRRRVRGFYNPIENVAPEWLPGHKSVFPGDRAGYLDFHTGDPYTALEKGEARLPVRGYEALHGLHSAAHGVYDEFDRFKILADVAPFSEAFKHYRRDIQSQVEMGLLRGQDSKTFYRTLDQIQERVDSKVSAGNSRFRSGAFAQDEVTISRVINPGSFQVHEMPGVTFKLAGVQHREYEMDATQLGDYGDLQSRMRASIGDTMSMTWGGSGVATPAILEGLNRDAIESGLGAPRMSPLGYRAKYGGGGLEAAWEGLMHTQAPGVFDWPRVKWLGQRSPVEEYEQFQAYGTSNTNWSHPWRNFVLPTWHQMTRTPMKEGVRARELTNYMDHLKYVKNRKIQMQAMEAGQGQIASQYGERAGQTMLALKSGEPNYWKNIYSALPPAERPYFNAFAGTTSEEEQERIIGMVPSYMRQHYLGQWKRKMPGNSFDSPILQRYAKAAESYGDVPVDTRVSEFFSQYPMPPKGWMGWHPGVDLEAVTIKTANQESIDIHQLGLWESQALRSDRMYPELEPISLDSGGDQDFRDRMLDELHRKGYESMTAVPSYSDEGDTRFRMRKKRSKHWQHMRSPYNAAAYTGGGW